jgi:hypothetical protein
VARLTIRFEANRNGKSYRYENPLKEGEKGNVGKSSEQSWFNEYRTVVRLLIAAGHRRSGVRGGRAARNDVDALEVSSGVRGSARERVTVTVTTAYGRWGGGLTGKR